MSTTYQAAFATLTNSLDTFISEVKNKKLNSLVTKEWTVKDVLCHIVFWHENYATNYRALAQHTTPQLPENMSTINQRGVSSLRKYSQKELFRRLQTAHHSLEDCIVEKKVPQMTYSKGGRTYKTDYFLEMITGHIARHTKQVLKAK